VDSEYEYQGQVWRLPVAMVSLQIELERAARDCQRLAETGSSDELAQAREQYRELAVTKHRDGAAWRDTFVNYDRWRADQALKEYVRGLPEFVPAAAAADE
jgi:hypothetical protein